MRAIIPKVGVLVVSAVISLGLLELTARFFLDGGNPEVGHHQLLCEHDPLLGWRKIAGADRRYSTPEYDIHERINAHGLRGPEIDYVKPDDVLRILILGDSFTEGYTVEEPQIFTEVLRRSIEAHSQRPIEVINGGTGGYSTDQELLFYRSEGRRYSPDMVVLVFVENDVWFNAQAEYPRAPKPLFRLEAGGLVLTNAPVPEHAAENTRPDPGMPPAGLRRLRIALTDHSGLYRLARNRIKATHWLYSTAIRLGLADAPDGEDSVIAMPDQWQVFRRQPTPAVDQAWTLTEALLTTLRDEVESTGARFVVINTPPAFDVDADKWTAIRRQYGIDDAQWSPSVVAERLARVTREHGIEFHDLTPAFAAATRSVGDTSDPLYFPIDGHWTARGHRLAGEQIAEFLARPSPGADISR